MSNKYCHTICRRLFIQPKERGGHERASVKCPQSLRRKQRGLGLEWLIALGETET